MCEKERESDIPTMERIQFLLFSSFAARKMCGLFFTHTPNEYFPTENEKRNTTLSVLLFFSNIEY
jgi:hypothetical protein